MYTKFTIFIGLILCAFSSSASQLTETVVFRDVDGSFSAKSRQGIREFMKVAAAQGDIQLWVAFDMPFEGNVELRTPGVVRSESQIKSRIINEVVSRMRGVTVVNSPADLIAAPGCMVKATPRGVIEIVREELIIHLSHHP